MWSQNACVSERHSFQIGESHKLFEHIQREPCDVIKINLLQMLQLDSKCTGRYIRNVTTRQNQTCDG
jgi:hypothetical protein